MEVLTTIILLNRIGAFYKASCGKSKGIQKLQACITVVICDMYQEALKL